MIDYNVWLSGAHSSTGEAAEGGGAGEGERTECPEEREEGPGAQKSDGTCLPVCQLISLPVSLSICLCFDYSVCRGISLRQKHVTFYLSCFVSLLLLSDSQREEAAC